MRAPAGGGRTGVARLALSGPRQAAALRRSHSSNRVAGSPACNGRGSAGDSCCRRRGIPAAPPAGRRRGRRAPVARGRWPRRVRRRPPAGSGRSARSAALRSLPALVRRDGSRCSRLAGGSPCAGAVRRREARAGLHRGGNAVRRRSPGRPARPARRTASGHGCRAARGSRCGGSPGRCRGRRRTARRRRPAGSTVVAVPA
ncbi:Uncharacterised protein [Pseudomonas aeruginosa]|nr:Uncharacterised protein [Pseudomonas aeruginosa]